MFTLPRISLAVALACSSVAPSLIAQSADTAGGVSTPPLFTGHEALAATTLAAGTLLIIPLDRGIAHQMQRPRLQSNRLLSGTSAALRNVGHPLTILALATVTYGAGRIGSDHRLADIGAHTGEAVAAAEVINFVIKGTAGRARPYVSGDTNSTDFKLGRGFREGRDYSSLASGHAVASFAAAAALAAEGQRWWPNQTHYVTPIAYSAATMVALSRLYDDQHWASDVFLGAVVGTFAGRQLVRHQHANTHNRLDRWLLSVSIAPGDGRAFAVTITP